ncbi:type VI secretion system tip protein TssI/VgrG [Pasteurella testudinis]|nr:type VI secretion system tip protein TssI/VgrG [Pasteurella testudinis]SUB52171.1 Uncharacterized protein conserved in bacteria [Pasteurella testudinis]
MVKKFSSKLGELTSSAQQLGSVAELVGADKVAKKVGQAQQVAGQVQSAVQLGSAVVSRVQSLGGNSSAVTAAAGSIPGIASVLSLLQKSPTGLQFTLTCQNQPDGTFQVLEFAHQERYNSLYELDVLVTSKEAALDLSAVLDNRASFKIWTNGEVQRQIHGMVTAVEQGDSGFHQSYYRLQLAPDMWRMRLRRNSRIFQAKTPVDIVEQLLKEHGISQYAFMLRQAHPAREFCVQYQESDFDFVQRLVAEEGIYYYFEQQESGTTLVLSDDAQTLDNSKALSLPYNLNKGAQLQAQSISTFSRSERVRPSHVQLKDYTFKNPNWTAQFSQQAQDIQHQRSVYEHYDFPGRFKDSSQGEAFTRYRLESLRNDAHEGWGKSNSGAIQPGVLLALTAHPNPHLNTYWQPVAVKYNGQQPQAAEQEAGDGATTLHTEFSFVPRHQTWRPLQQVKPRVDGPQIAMVVGPKGEEIYCDNFGRIRLQFLWDRDGQSDDHSSCWIRVTQPWAGKGWGMLAIPRVGQEVVVDFLDGDPDQPIVTGRTYHATNMPPGALPANKTQMHLDSQTYKGGGYNGILMEDATDNQRLDLRAQKDMNTYVLNNKQTQVNGQHIEQVAKKQNISIQGHRKKEIAKNEFSRVALNNVVNISGNKKTVVNKQLLVSSKNGDICLSTGGSRITLTKAGIVAIEGSGKITVNGQNALYLNQQKVSEPPSPMRDLLAMTIALSNSVASSQPDSEKDEALLGALLSQDVYHDKAGELPEGVKRLSDDELNELGVDIKLLRNDNSGFYAAVYQKNGTYFLAYRGTEMTSKADIKADYEGGVGILNRQFVFAQDLAVNLQENLPHNSRMITVGHSLGGELASIGALSTEVTSYTYNSAGLHPKIQKALNIDQVSTDKITAFYANNDLLNLGQNNRKAVGVTALMIDGLASHPDYSFNPSSIRLLEEYALDEYDIPLDIKRDAFGVFTQGNIPEVVGKKVKINSNSGHSITPEFIQGIKEYYEK